MDNRLLKLRNEMSHLGTGYEPTQEEIQNAILVGTGRVPSDVVYGEQPLQAPAVAGGLVSLDPTDYLSGAGLAKAIALAKAGGSGLGALSLGIKGISSLAAQKGITTNPSILANALRNQAGSINIAKEIKPSKLAYQIEHKPMTIEGGASPLHDLSGSFDDSIYSKEALQNYGSGDSREKQILNILKQAKGNPDAMVTIYRGAPIEAGGINPGDWVTLHPQVAQDYVNQAIKNEGRESKVYSMKVPAAHITAWPDSLLEQGYYPK